MKSEQVTRAWEFYRDNCIGYKEPMRKEMHRLDDYVASVEAENAKLLDWCGEMLDSLMPEICAKAYWCEEKDWCTCNDDSCGNYSFVIISRELGIEVDG